MLMVVSPAKSLDFTPPAEPVPSTAPRFGQDTASLARTARNLTRADLKRMMSISDSLAKLNVERFKAFDLDPAAGTLQAAFAFNGDVYQGLDARSLSADDLDWAQDRLRILSGLYGLLRPLDRIQPYRLEMSVRVKTRRGASLYDFWGARIARLLREDAEGHADRTLVNLASQEYFAAVDLKALKLPVLNVRFLEEKDGEARILSFFAKKARGLMARWAITHRVEHVAQLKDFDAEGYRFVSGASTANEWAFSRPQPAPVNG